MASAYESCINFRLWYQVGYGEALYIVLDCDEYRK